MRSCGMVAHARKWGVTACKRRRHLLSPRRAICPLASLRGPDTPPRIPSCLRPATPQLEEANAERAEMSGLLGGYQSSIRQLQARGGGAGRGRARQRAGSTAGTATAGPRQACRPARFGRSLAQLRLQPPARAPTHQSPVPPPCACAGPALGAAGAPAGREHGAQGRGAALELRRREGGAPSRPGAAQPHAVRACLPAWPAHMPVPCTDPPPLPPRPLPPIPRQAEELRRAHAGTDSQFRALYTDK